MDFRELIKRRESCRSYDGRLVSDELLEACIEAARLAPSACNSQPWRFIAVNDKESIARLAPCVQEMGMNRFASDAGALVVVTETDATLKEHVAAKLTNQYFAPGDVGIATAHFVLMAAELGLDTCILGWLNAEKIASLLDVPKGDRVRYVIAVGTRTDAPVREKKRKKTSDIYVKKTL